MRERSEKTQASVGSRRPNRVGSSERDSEHRSGGDWSALDIPSDLKMWQPKEGTYTIDIVPYEAKPGRNPYAKKGGLYYERTYFVHKSVGPNNERAVCLAKTLKKPCPICEHRLKLMNDSDRDSKELKEMLKALRPQERQLWLVFDHKDDNRGVQLWDISNFCFGELLDKRRNTADDDDHHIIDFDDPDGGSVLRVSFSEEKIAVEGSKTVGFPFIKAYAIDFKARRNGLDPELMEHGIDLDDIIKIMSYEELKKAFEGRDDDDQDEDREIRDEDKTSRRRGREEEQDATTAEAAGLEEGMMIRHRKFGVCEIVRISGDGTSLTIRGGDDEVHKAVGCDDVRIEEEKEKPAKGVGKGRRVKEDAEEEKTTARSVSGHKSVGEDSDEEEEEEGEEEEKPTRRRTTKGAKAKNDDWD